MKLTRQGEIKRALKKAVSSCASQHGSSVNDITQILEDMQRDADKMSNKKELQKHATHLIVPPHLEERTKDLVVYEKNLLDLNTYIA